MKKLLLALAACCFILACEKPNNEQPEPTPDPGDGSDTTQVEENPDLKLTTVYDMSVSAEGGTLTIGYEVVNPVEGGEISASVPEGVDWCIDFDCGTESEVTFTVAPNREQARETEVTVTYTYGDAQTLEFQVTVSQEALPLNVFGQYFADDKSDVDGNMVYQLWFSYFQESAELAPETVYYVVSIVSGTPSSMNAIAPADGTYALSSGTQTEIGTIWNNPEYTYVAFTDAEGTVIETKALTAAEISITKDRNIRIVEGTLVDEDNVTYTIEYTGGIILDDVSEPEIPEDALSTLEGDAIDFNAAWTSTVADASFYGTMGAVTDAQEWSLSIKDASYQDFNTLVLTVYMPLSSTYDDGIISGTYPINDSDAENTVRAGYLKEGSTTYQGSWLHDRTYTYPNTAAGPLVSGNVTFTDNGDGTYDITVDAEDDAFNNIRATLTDVRYVPFDMTPYL